MRHYFCFVITEGFLRRKQETVETVIRPSYYHHYHGKGHQWSSTVIEGHQLSSTVINCHKWSSKAIIMSHQNVPSKCPIKISYQNAPSKFLLKMYCTNVISSRIKMSLQHVTLKCPLKCPIKMSRGQIRPAILQNPEMDTFRPTEPLSPRKDTLILLWPSKLVKMSFFRKIYLQFLHFSWHLI